MTVPAPRRVPSLPLLALIVAVAAALCPVIRNGFVWDDPDYVTNNPTLRSAQGLAAIWTDPTALPQWYPMVHTTYWLEYQAWQLSPLGYHLDNVLLHLAGAILLWRLLYRLQIPGAWLAAMLFALHPIHVESVAWITERKNTLSTIFYFAAALTYLRTTPGRALVPTAAAAAPTSPLFFPLSILLFIAAVSSKTVTCTLPAAILLMIWWRQGRIAIRHVLPLLPMFAIGLAAGLVTAHLEVHHVGATGPHWKYADSIPGEILVRTLIATRAIWFYATKLLIPTDLAFIYPRWHLDAAAPIQYGFAIALVAVFVALVILSRRLGRGILVAPLFFIGTLTPALGYFNVYPMQFSYVADHFQHLASVGLTTAAAALLTLLAHRIRAAALRPILSTAVGLVLLCLAALSARQCLIYQNPLTLWTDTVARNPNSWLAQYNLARAIIDSREDDARFDDAAPHLYRAVAAAPDQPDPHVALGAYEMQRKNYDLARRQFDLALTLRPDLLAAMVQLGILAQDEHNPDLAQQWFTKAITTLPRYAPAHAAYGRFLVEQNRPADAIVQWRAAVDNEPENPDYRFALATTARQLHLDDEAWTNLGWGYLLLGDHAAAANGFREALAANPAYEPAKIGLDRAVR